MSPGSNGIYTEACPYCGEAECQAEWVDVEIGFVQMGPFHCDACGAFEIGPNDDTTPSDIELKTGWYAPNRQPLPHTVSSIGGKRIDSQTALDMYRRGIVDQVPFHIEAYPSRSFAPTTADRPA
jgi:hypothetical protein